MSKIYLSGPISGMSIETSMANFIEAKKEIFWCLDYCHTDIVNPFDIKPFLGLKNWWCYMITDLYALSKCDSVYMLRSWRNSRGACIEHLYAVWNKKTIIYQE